MIRSVFICILMVFFALPTYGQTLLSDDFQDDNTDGWKGNPGKGDIRLTSYKENISMRLQHDAYAIYLVPTKAYENINVSVDFAAEHLRPKHYCMLETSFGGGVWTEIGRVGDGQDDATSLHKITGRTPNASGHKLLAVRLRIAANKDNATCWADNVLVTGKRVLSSLAQNIPREDLISDAAISAPYSTIAFIFPTAANSAIHKFQGRLSLSGDKRADGFTVLKDQFGFENSSPRINQIPGFAVDLVSDGERLIPVQRGPQPDTHPDWEWMFEPGKIWQQAGDNGWSRASLPIAWQERNANCIHNGLMSFLFKDGQVSNAIVQIGSETCAYFQFDMWSKLDISYTPNSLKNAKNIIDSHNKELAHHLLRQPIQTLTGTDIKDIGATTEINPDNMTTYGFAVSDRIFASPCPTRFGDYPFCQTMPLPSYSAAKSMVAGIGLIRLEMLYPGARTAKIADYVPQCTAKNWRNVTFENTLDMGTGNYTSATHDDDEAAPETWKFLSEDTHALKIEQACKAHKRRVDPGAQFVYHTTDTYILGTAMQNYLREKSGRADADIYVDVLVPIWQALHLGPLLDQTRRTYDDAAQTFTGWGLTLHADDIVRIAQFLQAGGKIDGKAWLDQDFLSAALQQNPDSRGHQAINKTLKYRAGFWAYNAGPYLGCKRDLWLPYMSAFGGIAVVLMPKEQIYYLFSDGHEYGWRQAAKAAHRLNPICETN